MSEIILELSLSRSSGVLAGVVASLSQAGIELKSQKLRRASEGRGGWLTVVGEGEAPIPSVLSERLNNTRGVDKLMRIVVDGEATLAEGKPLHDQMQATDLAELSAASETQSQSPKADTRKAPRPAPERPVAKKETASSSAKSPLLSDPDEDKVANRQPGPASGSTASSSPKRDDLPPLLVDDEPDESDETVTPAATTRHTGSRTPEHDDSVERDLAEALGGEEVLESDPDQPTPEFAAEPSDEGDLADALQQNEDADPATDDETDPERVMATLRRRRRRRR